LSVEYRNNARHYLTKAKRAMLPFLGRNIARVLVKGRASKSQRDASVISYSSSPRRRPRRRVLVRRPCGLALHFGHGVTAAEFAGVGAAAPVGCNHNSTVRCSRQPPLTTVMRLRSIPRVLTR